MAQRLKKLAHVAVARAQYWFNLFRERSPTVLAVMQIQIIFIGMIMKTLNENIHTNPCSKVAYRYSLFGYNFDTVKHFVALRNRALKNPTCQVKRIRPELDRQTFPMLQKSFILSCCRAGLVFVSQTRN